MWNVIILIVCFGEDVISNRGRSDPVKTRRKQKVQLGASIGSCMNKESRKTDSSRERLRESRHMTHTRTYQREGDNISREGKGRGGGGGVGTHAYPQTRRTVPIGMMQMSTPTISSGRIASTVECFRDRRTEISLLQIGNHHHHHRTVFPSNKISLM